MVSWDQAPIPDEAFQQVWAGCLPITDWGDWRLAPAVMTWTEAAAWSHQIGSTETIALSSGATLVRRPGTDRLGYEMHVVL